MKPATKEILTRMLQAEIDILNNQLFMRFDIRGENYTEPLCRLTLTDISLFRERLKQYEETLEDLKGAK